MSAYTRVMDLQRRCENKAARMRGEFSTQVRYDDNGTPHCPKCGNTNFRARRGKAKLATAVVTVGIGAVLTSRNKVECTACKTRFNVDR